jgi:hypothetical protein
MVLIQKKRQKMLPDYPEIKKYLRREFILSLEKDRKDPLLSTIPVHVIHEGNIFSTTSVDGFSQEGAYKEIAAKWEVSREEMMTQGPEAYFSSAEKVAKELDKQKAKQLIEKIEEATQRTGNIVDAKSKPLSPDLILSALDKIAIDFDELGNPVFPYLVVSPEQFEKIKADIPKWESDPITNVRYKLIIDKKRQEWIDRENNRKLVD